jgi:hypothetical protein
MRNTAGWCCVVFALWNVISSVTLDTRKAFSTFKGEHIGIHCVTTSTRARAESRAKNKEDAVKPVLLHCNFQDNARFEESAYVIRKDDTALKNLSDHAHAANA